MAITRAQQVRQMLEDGGMLVQPSMTGKRPGYRGDAAARSTGAAQSGRADPGSRSDPGEGRASKGSGVSESTGGFAPTKGKGASVGPSGRDDTVDPTRVRESKEEFETAVGKANLERLYDEGVRKSNFPGLLGFGLNATKKFRDFALRKNIDYFEGLKSRNRLTNYPSTLEGYSQYMKDRSAGTIDAAGNPISRFDDDSNDNQIIFPQDTEFSDGNNTDDNEQANNQTGGMAFRFLADGGMPMDAPTTGGIMDLETGRQMYFLGKLVKKATRAVKKIAKSPIGKAAIIGGLGYLGATKFGGFTGLKSKLFGTALPKALGRDAFMGMAGKTGTPGLLSKLGLVKGYGSMMPTLGGGMALASLAPLAFGTGEEEEEDQTEDRGPGLDIDYIRRNPYTFIPRRFAAEGGSMKEPVAKKTMPLLDMGGKEMDLREEGGFVPLGRMERADDVPARLSKNEFVFTADAVRNAGDGSVDKGAEVMYNMMKNLESGGEVSEESQGLEGAREMFQTSKRLEEVI